MPIQILPEDSFSFLPPSSPGAHPGKTWIPFPVATADTLGLELSDARVKRHYSGNSGQLHDSPVEDPLDDDYTSLLDHYHSCDSSRTPSPTPTSSPSRSFQPLSTDPQPVLPDEESVMPKKRRSLQAILVPSFFQSAMSSDVVVSSQPASSNVRFRSHSAAASTSHFALPPAIPIPPLPTARASDHTPRNSPPSDLLDDDPFADLSSPPSSAFLAEPSTSSLRFPREPSRLDTILDGSDLDLNQRQTPRSPLSNSFTGAGRDVSLPWDRPPQTPPSTPVDSRQALPHLRRPRSSGQGQVRPAYTRPAFSTRPSLPSLSTLAQMHVIVPKVKRGRVGAQLPAEPWGLSGPLHVQSSDEEEQEDTILQSGRSSALDTISDSSVLTAELDDDLCLQSLPDSTVDGAEIARSVTPRASEANRASATALLRAQSDPTSAHSGVCMLTDDHRWENVISNEVCSSPESSFPPTPQSADKSPILTSHDSDSFLRRFPRQATSSIYDDLAATLDYDYPQTMSDLLRPPSLGAAIVSGAPSDECEFEPSTSARTVRNFLTRQSIIHTPHHRPASAQSATVEWTLEMDGQPVFPNTSSSFASYESTSSSATSSEYGDNVDFLSLNSDSDEDSEYITAPGSHNLASRDCPSPSGSERLMEDFDHGTSSGADITARLDQINQSDATSSRYTSADEAPVDGGDAPRRGESRGSNRAGSDRQTHTDRSNGFTSSRGGNGSTGGHGGSGGGRRGNDEDDWNRRPPARIISLRADSDTSESEEDSADDYGEAEKPSQSKASQSKASQSRASQSRVSQTARHTGQASSDDDVPLAQQIPTALRAQRTIRRQVKDEIDQRKRARSTRRPATSERSPPVSPSHATKPLPMESISVSIRAAPSSSQEAAQSASAPLRRPRTKTMPSQPASPFAISDLTKKLLNVQIKADTLPLPSPQSSASRRPSHEHLPRSPVNLGHPPLEQSARSHHDRSLTSRTSNEPSSASPQRLMPMRSFHRPRTATSEHEGAPPVPVSGARLGRSATTASRKHHDPPSSSLAPTRLSSSKEEGRTSLDRARSTRSHSRRPSADRSSRPSDEHARPPMPTLTSGEVALAVSQITWQQRIFVGNMQRYCQVEISSSSTAKDVLEILQNQGALEGSATGWMVFEVCQDFGMERPIRSFEAIADVSKSWVTDKTVNMLMAKKTLLAPKLSRAAIPTSSPICSGWIQFEYKRGKWQKRWLELREHCLWLSKRDSGKDETMLCSLNNFDAYAVTRVSKAPKPLVFAVKSTDNLSYFESTADYVHIFACGEQEGHNWLEKILLARSYILHQERNVLSGTTSASTGAALSRAGTRKRPAQPLVNFGGPITSESPTASAPVFEPGSLLAKRGF